MEKRFFLNGFMISLSVHIAVIGVLSLTHSNLNIFQKPFIIPMAFDFSVQSCGLIQNITRSHNPILNSENNR